MNALSVIGSLLGKVPEAVATYYTRKQELAAQRHENDLKFEQAKGDRQADLIRQGLAADANWESTFAQQAASSYKDEYTLVIVSVPAVLCFVKTRTFDGAVVVARGFDALGRTPTWFQFLLVTLFLATVGIRYWRRNQSDTQ